MAQEALFTPYLYSAFSIVERASYLRQSGGSIELKARNGRAAGILDRWKSPDRFPTSDFFEQRLQLDGITENDLSTIVGLPPESYSELVTSPPNWVCDLERLYLTPCLPDDDPNFLRYTQEGTN